MPAPVLSPVQIVAPVIPPAGTADPFGRGDGFRFRLSKGDVGRISDTIYDLAVRVIGGAAVVEGG